MARAPRPSEKRRYIVIAENDILDPGPLRDAPPECFRFYISMLAVMNRTKTRGDSCVIDRYTLMACAGRSHLPSARRVASKCRDAGMLTLEQVGENYAISICNYAKSQDLRSYSGRDSVANQSPPIPTPIPTPIPKTHVATSVAPGVVKRPFPPIPPEACFLADQLAERAVETNPKCKIPNSLAGWANDIRLAIQQDGRTPEELNAAIEWVFGPVNQSAEARFEVWSGRALRDKFDRIERQMQRPKNGAGGTPRPGKLERMAETVRQQRIEAYGPEADSHSQEDASSPRRGAQGSLDAVFRRSGG